VLVALFFVAIFGSWLAPDDPNHVDLGAAYQGPSRAHWLGTDSSGRDLLSRLLVGGKTTLLAPIGVAALATIVGTTIGIAAAWFGGRSDRIVARGLDIGLAFPGLLVAILAVAIFGTGLTAPVLALALVYVPFIARVVRSQALRERSLPYIASSTVQGFSGWHICVRELLPNIASLVASQAILAFSFAVVDLAAINFLGLGIQPPNADWGVMVAEGQAAILRGSPQESLYAGGLIVLAVVCVNLLGERLTAPRTGAEVER
jgi:peptide/nickel transport system permease protein